MRPPKLIVSALALAAPVSLAEGELRLLTWRNYAPEKAIELFEKETGIDVQVTFSNNEEMIPKLRDADGGGFDLAQPSHDRVYATQLEHNIYKPLDLSKIDLSAYDPSLLDAVRANATIDGRTCCVPAKSSRPTPGTELRSSSTRRIPT